MGSVGTAANKNALKSLNVTHILTVAGKLPPAHPGDFVYKIIDGKVVFNFQRMKEMLFALDFPFGL